MPWSLTGADGPKRSLEGLLRSGRIPHAVLLTGPEGGGKFTFAKDLAMAVNCEAPGAPAPPCGTCLSCRKISEGNHPDLNVAKPRGKKGIHRIEDVRKFCEGLSLRPFEGRYKVLLVCGADRFTDESGGAFLKTLEEPTPNTFIVMTAPAPSAVMATLVSRCLLFRIPPLSRKQILLELSLRKGLTGPDAELAAGLSGGALGRALAMDAAAARTFRERMEEVFSRPKGPRRLVRALMLSGVMAADYDALKAEKPEKGSGDDENRAAADWLELAERSLMLWWRDAAVLGASGDEGLLDGPPPSGALRSFARELDPSDLPAFEDAVARLTDSLRRFIRSELAFDSFWSSVIA
ncbi:MAG: DNA polymerase III subunit [Deltaproteobacteria bacterium]|jgi:DNA polymerase III delta prime subunit|nr:DNA polymerase III subunit [Deltaproteobacteria bacterium]